jgi:hypothetical protein
MRTPQDSLAASIARLRALLQLLEEAQTKPDPFYFLAVTSLPDQQDPRRATP